MRTVNTGRKEDVYDSSHNIWYFITLCLVYPDRHIDMIFVYRKGWNAVQNAERNNNTCDLKIYLLCLEDDVFEFTFCLTILRDAFSTR